MPKWVYPLAFAFVIYYIFNDGLAAGQMGRGFAGFIGNALDALGEFFSALTSGGDAPAEPPAAPNTTVTLPPIEPTTTLVP